jgi:4'-phosphopantetheinyl transferase
VTPNPRHTTVAEVWLATPEAGPLLEPSRLSAAERNAWAAIRTPRRRRDWAASRALLAAVPAGSDGSSSLTHSRGFAALARVSAAAAVGVDIEWLAERDFIGMAGIAFAADEAEHLATIDDAAARRAAFYELWTLKEAFGKALQLPLADALQRCRFRDGTGRRAATVPTDQPWRAHVYAPRTELRLAVAWIASTPEDLPVAPGTFEWPPARSIRWPIICCLDGPGMADAGAC